MGSTACKHQGLALCRAPWGDISVCLGVKGGPRNQCSRVAAYRGVGKGIPSRSTASMVEDLAQREQTLAVGVHVRALILDWLFDGCIAQVVFAISKW